MKSFLKCRRIKFLFKDFLPFSPVQFAEYIVLSVEQKNRPHFHLEQTQISVGRNSLFAVSFRYDTALIVPRK